MRSIGDNLFYMTCAVKQDGIESRLSVSIAAEKFQARRKIVQLIYNIVNFGRTCHFLEAIWEISHWQRLVHM